jgi:hypothetical protein
MICNCGAVDREASQTRDYCVAKYATQRAARPDPSLRKERLLRMTIGILCGGSGARALGNWSVNWGMWGIQFGGAV